MTGPSKTSDRERVEGLGAYYAYTFFVEFLPFIPILIAFQKTRGLTFTEITLLQAVYYLSFFVLEIPTGALADLAGLRLPLAGAAAAMAAASILCAFATGFWPFLGASLLLAVGKSLASGSDSAYLYTLLASHGRQDDYPRAEGRILAIRFVSFLVAAALGGYLASLDDAYPFHAASLVLATAFLLAALGLRPVTEAARPASSEKVSIWRQTRETIMHCLSQPRIRQLLLFSAFAFAYLRLASLVLLQPYLLSLGFGKIWFGGTYAAVGLVAACTAILLPRFLHRGGAVLAIIALATPLTLTLIGTIPSSWALALFVLPSIASGLHRPLSNTLFQRLSKPGQRATLLSIDSLVSRVTFAALTLTAGFLLDRLGMASTNAYLGRAGLVLAVPVILATRGLVQQVREVPRGTP